MGTKGRQLKYEPSQNKEGERPMNVWGTPGGEPGRGNLNGGKNTEESTKKAKTQKGN